jgi:hypothetical protein
MLAEPWRSLPVLALNHLGVPHGSMPASIEKLTLLHLDSALSAGSWLKAYRRCTVGQAIVSVLRRTGSQPLCVESSSIARHGGLFASPNQPNARAIRVGLLFTD